MRYLIYSLSFSLCFLIVNCSHHGELFEQWKNLDAYHTLMSQAFHSSEDGDLDPVKELSAEMLTKVTVLVESKVPEKYDSDKMQSTLQKLKADTELLDQMVKNNSSDEEISTSLVALHEVFHEVIKLCEGE